MLASKVDGLVSSEDVRQGTGDLDVLQGDIHQQLNVSEIGEGRARSEEEEAKERGEDDEMIIGRDDDDMMK